MLVERLRNSKVILFIGILVTILVSLFSTLTSSICRAADEKIWYVYDAIEPSLDEVRWREQGGTEEARPSIAAGLWFGMSKRESLVSAGDIFVSTYERLNWSRLAGALDYVYDLQFADFNEFVQYLLANRLWWLNVTWDMNPVRYGILSNTTEIDYSFNEVDSEAELWTSFHVTRIPEYFIGSERLETWLVGFDLTPISTGNLRLYEFRQDSGMNGSYYNLYFEAPANILAQHGDNFTFSLDVTPSSRGQSVNMQQVININMPPNTEVKQISPLNMSVASKSNTATFVLAQDDRYPSSFMVVSGPPAKSFGQVVWENASVWIITPGGWAAIASLLVLSFTALRGRRIWRRSRLYHHLYNSMVTIYDLYSKDVTKFHQEMANVSTSVFKLLIEDKITDDQFEKLLLRRDDLLKRVLGVPPPP
jgi:hypothetical protein